MFQRCWGHGGLRKESEELESGIGWGADERKGLLDGWVNKSPRRKEKKPPKMTRDKGRRPPEGMLRSEEETR